MYYLVLGYCKVQAYDAKVVAIVVVVVIAGGQRHNSVTVTGDTPVVREGKTKATQKTDRNNLRWTEYLKQFQCCRKENVVRFNLSVLLLYLLGVNWWCL